MSIRDTSVLRTTDTTDLFNAIRHDATLDYQNNGEVARLKALNFDLLTATPAPPPDETPEEEPTPDTQSGIDALFGDKE